MKNILLKSIYILCILVSISFILVQGLIINDGHKRTTENVDYVIILGARLYGDIPSPSLLERLKVSKDYLMENKKC